MSALEDLPEEPPHPERVRLRFLQSGEDRAVKEARVLAGTTIFDAASWNGVAIDSTCGGHGTCKKCKIKVISGHAPISSVDPRAFTIEELKNGWRLACRAKALEDVTLDPHVTLGNLDEAHVCRGHRARERKNQRHNQCLTHENLPSKKNSLLRPL